MRVLVIEDEQKVSSFIKSGLEELGHSIETAFDGETGERLALKKDYDIVLLDIVLPLVNGFDVCRHVKTKKPNLPILMLTALGTTDDKMSGFESGADDYLLKPFEFVELVARIKALTRRTQTTDPAQGNVLEVANLRLDVLKKVAFRDEISISLTAKEFALLEYFMKNRDKVISRVELAEKVWDITFDTGTNVVEVYMNILRKKIDRDFEPKLLHTRIGMGYIMEVRV